MFEKVRQCAGTLNCRFRFVLRFSIALLALAIVGVLLFSS